MKNTDAFRILSNMKQKWQWLKATELLLLALGIGAFATSLIYLFSSVQEGVLIATGIVITLGIFIALFEWRGVRRIKPRDVAQYLNRNYAQLENSTELVLAPIQELNLLAQIQQSRVSQQLNKLAPQIKLPHQLSKSILIALLGGGLAVLLFNLDHRPTNPTTNNVTTTVPTKLTTTKLPKNLPAQIKKVIATVQPPAYTRLGNQISPKLSIKAPENSLIYWSVSFKGKIEQAVIVINSGDSLFLKKPKGKESYGTQWTLKEKGFYQILFKQAENNNKTDRPATTWKTSDFFALEPIRDTRPKLALSGVNDYEELLYKPGIDINFKTKINDDYGITDAYIVATVSKGQGESVKFREQKLRFDSFASGRRSYQLQKTINLQKLGMAPGDELYFFVEAIDNKAPQPQKGRTEVYFVTIQDTTREHLTVELGTGIKKLPDYFRSQRQLIIDTENLLRKRATTSTDTFNYKSNGIGVDQKILRLRYGKFLGEEYEISINGGGFSDHDHDHDHDHDKHEKGKKDTVRYLDKKTGKMVTEIHYDGDGHGENDHGHKRWKKKLSSLDILKRNQKDHNHKPKSMAPSNNPLDYVPADIMHMHDVMEEASFFDEVLKKQLKQALTNMWESELRLRTNRPKESLPYQYKALKLIKQIQQKSRVYVERIGFEPPPIKEKEKRLKGELEDIQNPYKKRTVENKLRYPYIRKTLPILEDLWVKFTQQKIPIQFTQQQKSLLQASGSELAEIAIEKPGQFLTALQSLQKLSQGQLSTQDLPKVLPYLIKTLWQALPQDRAKPSSRCQTGNRLLELYLNKLGQ